MEAKLDQEPTIQSVEGWQIEPLLDEPEKKGLCRTFIFSEYRHAARFATMIADLADKVQHHPDILIKYKKVRIISLTHDQSKVTVKDTDIAVKINELYNSIS